MQVYSAMARQICEIEEHLSIEWRGLKQRVYSQTHAFEQLPCPLKNTGVELTLLSALPYD